MSDQNSTVNNLIRPDELIAELGVSKATYYEDLSHLSIKASKDENKKAYLTFEQAEQVRQLRSHVIEKGTRKGFVYQKVEDESNIGSSIVTTTGNDIEAASGDVEAETAIATAEGLPEQDIYVDDVNPMDNMDRENLIRAAQELAARNIAIPKLIITELANQMEFDDLPPDLQEKIRIAEDAANPKKYQPQAIADGLLKQLRSQRAA